MARAFDVKRGWVISDQPLDEVHDAGDGPGRQSQNQNHDHGRDQLELPIALLTGR